MNESLIVPSHGNGIHFCFADYHVTNASNTRYKIPTKQTNCTLPIEQINNQSGGFTLENNEIIVPYDGMVFVQSRICVYNNQYNASSSSTVLSTAFGLQVASKFSLFLGRVYECISSYISFCDTFIASKNDKISFYACDSTGNCCVNFINYKIVYF